MSHPHTCTCTCSLVVVMMAVMVLATPLASCYSHNIEANNTSDSLQMAIEEALDREKEENGVGVATLSRHRRYLIFPEGSSLQVVFCLTYGSNIQISDIFYLGATASLAWELPQDPYSPFDHHAEALHRIDTDKTTNTFYPSGWGQRISMNKFDKLKKFSWAEKKDTKKSRRKPIINPAFAKRSVLDNSVNRSAMHEEQSSRPHLNPEYMDKNIIEHHRRTRRTLYNKIEKLLVGLGSDGRQCVLKTLCEMGQDRAEGKQGTFLDEIMRTVFTLPKGESFQSIQHKAYDEAHTTSEDCDKLFPNCPKSLKSMPLR